MSRAIEDSKQKAIVVGGAIVPLEDRTIEIPPEKAKDFTQLITDIENGEYIVISVKDNTKETQSPEVEK